MEDTKVNTKTETTDPIAVGMHNSCDAALAFIRAVRWGKAVSFYNTTDGDLNLNVTVTVECYSKADRPPTTGER